MKPVDDMTTEEIINELMETQDEKMIRAIRLILTIDIRVEPGVVRGVLFAKKCIKTKDKE